MGVMRTRGESSRLPIHGKIKAGKKGGPQGRQAISTWRFHSPDQRAVAQIAELYGGDVVVMNDPKANPPNQWQVTTPAEAVRVWLPANALQVSEYEMRDDKGRLMRRCDGETCTLFAHDWDGVTRDCICNLNERRECRPTVVLDVLLPEVHPFSGVWRFVTHSWYALEEIPAMEQIIHQMQTMGIAEAELTLSKRSAIREINGKMTKTNFVVAGLRTYGDWSLEQIMSGESARPGLGTGAPQRQLTMGTTTDPPDDDDDQVLDAELVTEDEMLISMCDAIGFRRDFPVAGLDLLLIIARGLNPGVPIEALPDVPDDQWGRLSEAVRGINDDTVNIAFTPEGVKLTRKTAT